MTNDIGGHPRRVFYYLSNVHRLTGAQRSLHAFLTGAPPDRLRPIVVVPGEGPTTTHFRESGLRVIVEPPPEEVKDHGGRLLRLGPLDRARLGVRAVVPYSARIARLLRDEEVELCHYNDSRALLLCGLGARLARIPTVWHVRGDVSGLGATYLHACGFLSDRVITVADAVRQSIPRKFRSRCATVHNGIDVPAQPATRSRAELLASLAPPVPDRAGALLVVMVGSLVPFKGAHHLLAAARKLEQAGERSILFVLVGDRPDPSYSRLLDRLEAEWRPTNIRFAGWDWQPLDWIRAADLVVLASVERESLSIDGRLHDIRGSEGLPRVILEAMACGRPVVATSVAGVPEQVVPGQTGLLVRPGDPEDLADAVRSLVAEPRRMAAFGARARARVAERFTVGSCVAATLRVYDDLLGGPS